MDDEGVPESWDGMPVFNRTLSSTGSAEAIDAIQSWLEECVDHKWRQSPEEPPLPTRVVDVGLRSGIVKLLESNGMTAKYLCLSHCWGLEQVITTTKSTISARKADIPLSQLSNTFRDAILLTRRLGFEYI